MAKILLEEAAKELKLVKVDKSRYLWTQGPFDKVYQQWQTLLRRQLLLSSRYFKH